jgi:type VI secretion system protein ImpA
MMVQGVTDILAPSRQGMTSLLIEAYEFRESPAFGQGRSWGSYKDLLPSQSRFSRAMASSPIDLETLLAPLSSGENGAGTDLRTDYSATSLYQKLRDARSEARAAERRRDRGTDGEDGRGDDETAPLDGWRTVLALSQKALAEGSKDFEIASWLTESLVRIHGFEGLAAGARLIAGLCRTYWDDGFPLQDEDGWEGRTLPIGGLAGAGVDGTIMQPLRMETLFVRSDGRPVTLYEWSRGVQIASLGEDDRAKALGAPGAVNLSSLMDEARRARSGLEATAASVSEGLEAWRDMDAALTERLGRDSPSTRNVGSLLEQVDDILRPFVGSRTAGTPADATAEAVPAAAGAVAASAAATAGVIRTREDALRELNKIAEFFRVTEPHSPLAYTLDEAVRRGRMSLSELLLEVLPNEEARQAMLLRLGMRLGEGS